jgi:GWxTD domain-containing protein
MRIKRILGYKDIPSFSHLSVFLPAVLAALLASSLYLAAQSSSTDQQTTLLKEESALPPLYRQWLEQDVRWIISPEERAAYLRLPDNNERDQFIKQFWERRNPESGSSENKVREEHYRRIAYAGVHFASLNTLGSMSDRGRIYISWGKPISIDSHPSGTAGSREAFEVWHYDSIRIKSGARVIQGEGLKENTETKRDVDLLFVDDCSCGNYRLKSELPM